MQSGIHKLFVLSALVFLIAMNVMAEYLRDSLLNKILFADNFVLMSKSIKI